MTDASVQFRAEPASDLFLLDLWSMADAPALPDGVLALPLEPNRWWCVAASSSLDEIETSLAGRGALTDIGGGITRAVLTGLGWRWLLTVSAFIDTEDPKLRPGSIVATVIHHVAVWIVPIAEDACEVYYPASYASSLEELWSRAIKAEGSA